MKPEQMRSTLVALADAFKSGGSDNTAHGLLQLASLFESVGFEVNWKESNRSQRYPKELKAILEKLEAAFSASAAKTQTKDFTALLRLFNGIPDQSIDTFVLEARNAAVAPKSKSPKGRSRNLSTDDISLVAKKLIGLKSDRREFDTLIEKCSKEITAISLIAIELERNRRYGRESPHFVEPYELNPMPRTLLYRLPIDRSPARAGAPR